MISIDGETGEVIIDAIKLSAPEVTGAAREFLAWADRYRTLGVRANADTPEDARQAARVRRRGHRPGPHRAHVLRRRSHRRSCAR